MTEKRFYVAESKLIDGYCVFDREKKYAFCPRPRMADCLNDAYTLNELAEENEQLKKEIERITKEKENWAFISDCSVQVMNEEEKFKEDYLRIATNDLKKLQEVNEQLKQQLFETSNELLWATSDEVDRALHYEDEVGELRKEIFE